jgi:hypothetical protein
MRRWLEGTGAAGTRVGSSLGAFFVPSVHPGYDFGQDGADGGNGVDFSHASSKKAHILETIRLESARC